MADIGKNIDIGIQSDKAKTGAARVRRALDSIKRKSRAMAVGFNRDTKLMSLGLKRIHVAAIGLAAILVGKGIVGSTKKFGQAVADLSAITGATGKDLDFLRQKSKEFGETTTLSASEAAEAFKVIASAKPDLLENVEALSLVTQEAIALAEATGEDLPTAANTLGASLNQFSAGSDQASRFINVLAAGSKRGAALVGEMAEALKFAGVIAAQAGLSFEQTNASLQLMSTFAIKGGEAGTQLRGVLLALASQSNSEFNPEIVGLQTALQNLSDAQLTSAQSTKLFGRRNLAAAKVLTQNRDRLAELTEQLTGTNIAYEQQAIRVDNLSGDVKALSSAYEGLELTIGAELNSTLRGLTQAATDNIRALAKNPLLQKGVRAILDATSIAMQDLKNVWQSLNDILTETGLMDTYSDAWSTAVDKIVGAVKWLWKNFVVGGPANIKLAVTLMIAAFDRFKIGLTTAVSVATVAGLQRFDLFRIGVVEKVSLIGPAVQRVFISLKHAVLGTFDSIRINIGLAISKIVDFIQQKMFSAARSLAELGFADQARNITNMGIAMGKFANAGDNAKRIAEEHEKARQAELAAIDSVIAKLKEDAETKRRIANDTATELIDGYIDTARAAVLGSQAAVDGAIAERDATILAIEALREKRKIIRDGDQSKPDDGSAGGKVIEALDAGQIAFEKFGEAGERVVDGISSGIADMAASGKASFADMARSIIQDLVRIAVQAQITRAISGIMGIFGGGANAAEGFGKGIQGIAIGNTQGLPGGRTGLDFDVGGVGGTDSKLVQFRATPGEHVNVSTPAQRGSAGQSNGGGGVVINQYTTVHAQGADEAAVLARLVPAFEAQKRDTLAAVMDLRDNGSLGLR